MLCLVELVVDLLIWEFPLYKTYLFRYWVVLSVLCLVEREVALLLWEFPFYRTYLFRYWVVLSVLCLVERVVDLLIWEFPLYSILKLLLLLWCVLPISNNGTHVIFHMASCCHYYSLFVCWFVGRERKVENSFYFNGRI